MPSWAKLSVFFPGVMQGIITGIWGNNRIRIDMVYKNVVVIFNSVKKCKYVSCAKTALLFGQAVFKNWHLYEFGLFPDLHM